MTWNWQKNKKLQLKLGERNPFCQQVDWNKTDFFGVVAFELSFDDIEGMENSNSLIKDFSRLVFEANLLRKVTFASLESFFDHYDLPTKAKGLYAPSINERGHGI